MRSSEICGRLMRDVPEVPENKRQRDDADGLCRGIALYAAGLADLSTEAKQQFIEKAIAQLQVFPRKPAPLQTGDISANCSMAKNNYENSRAAIEKNLELRGEKTHDQYGPRWWYLTMLLARAGETETANSTLKHYARNGAARSIARPLPRLLRELTRRGCAAAGDLAEDSPTTESGRTVRASARPRRQDIGRIANWGRVSALPVKLDEVRRAYAAAAAICGSPRTRRTPGDGNSSVRDSTVRNSTRRPAAFKKNLELRGESQPTISNSPRWWYLALLLARTGDTAARECLRTTGPRPGKTHPAPNLAYNEHRAELAELLGIDDQPTAASEQPQEIPPPGSIPARPGQVADPAFDPQVTHPEYEVGAGPRVLIDEGHRNMHTLGGRFAPFARLLERDGYRVAAHSGQFTSESLADVDVLVIANARAESPGPTEGESASAFTDEEMDCIHDWLAGGGSLLLAADHMPFGGAAARLAQRFDIEMINGYAVGADRQTPTIFRAEGLRSHPITQGRNDRERVEQVATFTGQAFRAGPAVQPLLVFGDGAFLMQPRRQRPGHSVNGPPSQQSVAGWLQGHGGGRCWPAGGVRRGRDVHRAARRPRTASHGYELPAGPTEPAIRPECPALAHAAQARCQLTCRESLQNPAR